MNTTVIILASGDHTRWFGNVTKQIVLVEGEQLLRRTLRLFANCEPILVHKSNELRGIAKREMLLIKSECACDTILQTRRLWTERVVLLLGDVFYTEDCVKRIQRCASTPSFFSDGCDIFAMLFGWNDFRKLEDACVLGMRANKERRTDGKCWDIFRHFVPEETHFPLNHLEPVKHVQFVWDRTQDFDLFEEYTQFVAGISKNHIYNHDINQRTVQQANRTQNQTAVSC